MKPITFIIINFFVSFFSDIVLNDLSRSNTIKSLRSLQLYFNQSIIKCAFVAGLTVVIALLINMALSYFLFTFVIPTNFIQLTCFCILAFFIGYLIDIIIYRFKLIDGLTNYYKEFGAGLWGAIAFVFSIVISYFIQKYILVRL
jgi:H+/Cl- antiporter ClcA